MVQVLRKEQPQLFRRLGIQVLRPGVGAAGGIEGRLPADQGGKASQAVHKPVAEQVRPGHGQKPLIIRLQGMLLGDGLRVLIVKPRQGGTAALVQADAPQAVDDPAVPIQQVQVAGPAHELRHQLLFHGVAHLVGAREGEVGAALHGQLLHPAEPGAGQMLAQEHAEHGRLLGIFRAGGGEMEPGRGRVRSK